MVQSSSNNKAYRLIIEKMHFNEPKIIILYGLFGYALFIILSYLGGYINKLVTDIVHYVALILLFYYAFVIRGFINKIHEFLEIGKKTQKSSPLRILFISEETFLKYRNKIINKIFSKWQLYFSILFLSSFAIAVVFYDIIIKQWFGKPFGAETVTIWGILITLLSGYLTWWVVIFASLSLIWALLWFIVGFLWLKDAEGLKLNESINSLKNLINIKEFDEETLIKSLEEYYTYNRFLADSRKITEVAFFLAVRISIFAIILSITWIWILGFIHKLWILPQLSFVIFIYFIAALMFIIPNFGIHRILKLAKTEISNIVNDIYELNKIRAVVRYASFSQAEENISKSMTFLKGIVDETNNLKTWTIDLQAVIRLTATIVPTVLPYLIQILSEWFKKPPNP